ncbi:hypothetical protein [Rhizobium sp. Root483D2]|uniref:hypothetical protein n=1 Tax=Rhizobium sp. Root483D2 TaxID=1736545 RepID=UPI0012E3C829|nr:hypothetical protein [Rhizobium sp. Root483D2]
MSSINEPMKRAVESLEQQAERHENHVLYLRAELQKAEDAGKQARADAAEIRKSLGQ